MKNTMRFLTVVAIAATTISFISCAKKNPSPETPAPTAKAPDYEIGRWFEAGSKMENYIMGSQTDVVHSGKKSGFIRSVVHDSAHFGNYMQEIQATPYLGKQVKMTSWMRVDSIDGWAGMWCRVDGQHGGYLDFDNMKTSNQELRKPCPWSEHSITVNVPPDAAGLAFGFLIHGAGLLYFDDVKFEIVGPCDTTKIHRNEYPSQYKAQAGDLGFEN